MSCTRGDDEWCAPTSTAAQPRSSARNVATLGCGPAPRCAPNCIAARSALTAAPPLLPSGGAVRLHQRAPGRHVGHQAWRPAPLRRRRCSARPGSFPPSAARQASISAVHRVTTSAGRTPATRISCCASNPPSRQDSRRHPGTRTHSSVVLDRHHVGDGAARALHLRRQLQRLRLVADEDVDEAGRCCGCGRGLQPAPRRRAWSGEERQPLLRLPDIAAAGAFPCRRKSLVGACHP